MSAAWKKIKGGKIVQMHPIEHQIAKTATKLLINQQFSAKSDKSLNSSKAIHLSLLVVFSLVFSLFIQTFYVSNASAASLTLSIPRILSLDIVPAGNNGTTYVKSLSSDIAVSTDAVFGYTLSIKSSNTSNGDKANDLMNGSHKLASITNTEGISEDDYKTSGLVNTWGYIPSKINGLENTNIMPGPSSTNTVIEKTAKANSDKNIYTIALASKIDNSLPSGEYTNSFTISAVSNSVSYTINYNLNQGTWNGKSPQAGSTIENSIKLDNNIPTRSGYIFKGWCTANPGTNNCPGTIYQANSDFPVLNDTNITLYAIWAQNYTIHYNLNGGTGGPSPNPYSGTAYGPTVAISNAAPTRAQWTFKGWCDKATSNASCSGKVYQPNAIYTLSAGTNPTLYAMWQIKSPLNFNQAFEAYGKVKQGSYYKMQDMTAAIYAATTVASASSTATLIDTRDNNTYTVAKLADGRCWMTKNLRITNRTLTTANSDVAKNFVVPASTATDFSGKYNSTKMYFHSTYGGYYNWFTATAGEGTLSKTSGSTSHSICPKGWRLPTQAEFNTLKSKYNVTTARQAPISIVLNGYYAQSLLNTNKEANYWSSTASRANFTYSLYLYVQSPATFGLRDGTDKAAGFGVRCTSR